MRVRMNLKTTVRLFRILDSLNSLKMIKITSRIKMIKTKVLLRSVLKYLKMTNYSLT